MQNHDIREILPIWQPIGWSTYQIANTVAKKLGVKVTHTGVLDPMAEGVVLILSGDKRYEKNKYTDCKKTYEFDISFGLSTDSYDGMGLITNEDFSKQVNEKDIGKALDNIQKDPYVQQVPLYSAVKVNSKKLFTYPRNNQMIDNLPTKTGKIYELSLKKIELIKLNKLVAEILSKLEQVQYGEFRQEIIKDSWNEYLKKNSMLNNDFNITKATFVVTMTRGLYVRSLSQDIANQMHVPAFISRLVRTQNGIYDMKCCLSLKDFM